MQRYTIEDHGEQSAILGYYIVDNATEGGKRVVHHSSLARAEAELARLEGGAAPKGSPLPETATDILNGPAGAVRVRVLAMKDAALLEELHVREKAGKARGVILSAIEDRLSAL